MPKVADYRLAWSLTEQTYHVQQTRDHALLAIVPESPAWFGWLEQVSSFAFRGQRGHYTARKESRARGETYWYAYLGAGKQLSKKYLGKSRELTLARLEEVAARLAAQVPEQQEQEGATAPPKRLPRSPTAASWHLSDSAEPPVLVTRRSSPLPVPLTSLLGREREVAAACTLLARAEVRLLTLTGTAGVGKTRLALAIATELREDFLDGVCFVSLAPLSDPALVLAAMAQALGLEGSGNRPPLAYLQASLREKQVLVLLDNFEQVVEAAPSLLDLLAACPPLKLLVTSREVLHVRGEREFPVLPLALPDPKHLPELETLSRYGAVALFLERTREVVPSFELTHTTAPLIAEICRRLDGLPLAIELAAARLKLLPLPALLERLKHRLAVLTGGPRDLPARQRTLRATIAWSYDLLSNEDQRLFRLLSAFVGGCTLEAVEQVAHALGDESIQILDEVASLLDKHLLQRAEQDTDAARLLMLETLREYGLEALEASGELEAARLAHAQYYLALAEEADAHLLVPEQEQWVDHLEREHDNLRAALQWSVEQGEDSQRREVAWRLAGALHEFWVACGYGREGQQFVERALARDAGVAASVRAKAKSGAGWVAFVQGEVAQAAALCQESLQMYRDLHDPRGVAEALYRLGQVTLTRGDFHAATSMFEESLALYRRVGDKVRLAYSLLALALTPLRRADHSHSQQVRSLLEESLELFREERHQGGIARSLYGLGMWHFQQGEVATARSLFEETLALYRALRQRQYLVHPLYFLGKVAARQGDLPMAHVYFQECLALCQELDDQRSSAACLEGWAGVVARQGETIWAAQMWGAAEVRRAASGAFNFLALFTRPEERADEERMRAVVRAELGDQAFTHALTEGRAMMSEQALSAEGHPLLSRHPPAKTTPRSGVTRQQLLSPSATGDLTDREMEVLRLVAQGLSDAQIADGLVISPRTVNAHLRSIYSKLGINSRHAATRYAIEHHLV